jgi:hypothetical protein
MIIQIDLLKKERYWLMHLTFPDGFKMAESRGSKCHRILTSDSGLYLISVDSMLTQALLLQQTEWL